MHPFDCDCEMCRGAGGLSAEHGGYGRHLASCTNPDTCFCSDEYYEPEWEDNYVHTRD